MVKSSRIIDSFFKRKDVHEDDASSCPPPSNPEPSINEQRPSKSPRVESKDVENNQNSLVRDPGLSYIKAGPYQFQLSEYPFSKSKHPQYSPLKDATFCLPCFLFTKPRGHGPYGSNAFTLDGFRNWKKVNDGTRSHNVAVQSCEDLMNQRCAFRGHDESLESKNRGNFIELLKILANYNDDVAKVVLENAPKTSKYTSLKIQKEIVQILSNKVRMHIREKIGDAKFCVLVDEARDVAKKEQMALVLRFLCTIFSRHALNVQNIRGQGYDGASNMRDAIEHMIIIDELETSKWAIQLENLQRAGDTRWSSHFHSICSLLRLFGPTCVVLQNIINDGSNYTQRGDADAAYDAITSFEFIFILHLMKEIMEFTNILCQALQQKSQDISNAMHLVSITKALIQNIREDGWESLLENVNSFCSMYEIDVPNMSDRYLMGRGRSSYKKEHITIEHHYRVEIFTVTIDSQLQELNNRFSEQAMELFTLSSALDPRDDFKSFNIDNICKLEDKFYPIDFTEHERDFLSFELKYYKLYVSSHQFPLIDRLIRLILILPVSTTTTERVFSAMKLVKTGLRNKMDNKFLANYLVVYIEKEIAEKFSSESIIDDFMSLREHPEQL
ncbi:hypothetical protein ACOSQ2_023447 [Xanthoceras sorbifolium]